MGLIRVGLAGAGCGGGGGWVGGGRFLNVLFGSCVSRGFPMLLQGAT